MTHKRGISALLTLAIVVPTMVLPVAVWHHHDHGGKADHCVVCVLAKHTSADLPAPVPTLSNLRPIGVQSTVVTPLTAIAVVPAFDARGPPAC